MKKQIHILNGDALKMQFPSKIKGDVFVMRECLVEGSVIGDSLDEFFKNRNDFLKISYGISSEDYKVKTIDEIEKIQKLNGDLEINLWFEDDLFCQVNLWFILYLFLQKEQIPSLYLVRSNKENPYDFSKLNSIELQAQYKHRIKLEKEKEMATLWRSFQSKDNSKLLETAFKLEQDYPFILSAVQAHLDRFPTNESQGRPKECLITIINELKTTDFDIIFKEFSIREDVYGFGDWQVKRLLNEMGKE